MAKGKGKSRRRVKDWQNRFEEDRGAAESHASREKFSPREVKLGDGSFSVGQADELKDMQQVTGMVSGVFRRGIFVRTDGGELYCGIAKTFRPPEGFAHTSPLAVGDDVTVALTRPEHTSGQVHLDRNRMDGMILSRRPRRTLLARPQPRSQKRRDTYNTEEPPQKVLAANMDVLLIVAATAAPAMRRGLIDRFLIVAERGELQPVLAVNKLDLAAPDETMENILADVAGQGVTVLRCSAASGEGLDEFVNALTGKRSVLAGASGVGKSTLINAIIPTADAATRTVRSKDNRGRHTTSQSRIYDLSCGGMIVDTPGVRELGVDLRPTELPWYFPEFEDYVHMCKFRDCTHTHEPGCGIREAVEQEKILPR
ncbi:MAG: ribosome small subunit-dependent GTPase A, partial [Phycisphaerae bacterium]|nr:ribosome small subunit-dependent GTPase A [Phycisphaerae bacterium]